MLTLIACGSLWGIKGSQHASNVHQEPPQHFTMRALQQWSSYGPEDLAYSDDVECQAEAMREEDERDRKKVEKVRAVVNRM